MAGAAFDKQQLFQVAYLVNDLDEAMEKWSRLFGAGPFVVTEHHITDKFMYRATEQEADDRPAEPGNAIHGGSRFADKGKTGGWARPEPPAGVVSLRCRSYPDEGSLASRQR